MVEVHKSAWLLNKPLFFRPIPPTITLGDHSHSIQTGRMRLPTPPQTPQTHINAAEGEHELQIQSTESLVRNNERWD